MSDRWFQCEVPRPDAERRLVCLPHAGGSAAYFRGWGERLADFEVRAVRYPGRAERIAEPAAQDMIVLGDELAEALVPLADRSLVLLGHSLGAVLALETARALESRGIEVAHLFASGSRNAPLPEPEPFDDDPEAVAAHLLKLGGTDAELAADPWFRELVLPYVIGDGRMFHAYPNPPGPLLSCPVTAIVGDMDEDADLRPWPSLTGGPFAQHVRPGGHFYLTDEPPFDLVNAPFATVSVS